MSEVIKIKVNSNKGIKRFLWVVLMSVVGYFIFAVIPFVFYFVINDGKMGTGIRLFIVIVWDVVAIYVWSKILKRKHRWCQQTKIVLRNNGKKVCYDKMKLRQIFNAVDPVGIYFGDNEDEYDTEINCLQHTFVNFSNKSELYKKLLEIFSHYFEGVDFDKKRVRKLAKIISREQRRFDKLKKPITNQFNYEEVGKCLVEKFPEYRKTKDFDENETDPYIILGGIGSLAFEDIDQKKDRHMAELLVEMADEIINDEKSDPKVTNLFVVEVLEHLTNSATGALLASGILRGESLRQYEQIRQTERRGHDPSKTTWTKGT